MKIRLVCMIASCALSAIARGHDLYQLPELEIQGKGASLVGEAVSASQGIVGQVDLETRPMLRVGEVLETIPGMIATQHSGSGKANQYFLRGFNLDHGTDFATWVDGMPVNMVSHGHGQGYSDLNFMIPELVESMTYLKGSYYASVGDFASSGSASIRMLDTVDKGMLKATIGEHENYRALVADSIDLGNGDSFLYGVERETNDGPWDLAEGLDKNNALFKYSRGDSHDNASVTFMGYDASWNATDQIPERVVDNGLISDLGFIDDSVGGESSRYSLSAALRRDHGGSATQASAYAIYYDMNLWSNFTYFLDDPDSGDQFEQADKRMIYGLSVSRTFDDLPLFQRNTTQAFGAQVRYDDIANVGLYHTNARERLSTTREDAIEELAVGLYYDAEIVWSGAFRTSIGIRGDYYDFGVDSDTAANSGSADDFQLSPKFNAIYTMNASTDLYLSAGYGFHSNDARGTTIVVDPSDGSATDSVDPLVRSTGAEIGMRHAWSNKLNTSVAVWSLDLDSELLYVGDAGNTEASRPSKRKGIEVANYYQFSDWLSFDLDLALTDASFSGIDPAGNEIPGAIDQVASAGLNFNGEKGWYGSLRYRHFGERPLVEDGSVKSDSFDAFNLRLGYRTERWQMSVDCLNVLDSEDHDITYFYESRLRGEADEGVEDRHYHRIPPRMIRASFTIKL